MHSWMYGLSFFLSWISWKYGQLARSPQLLKAPQLGLRLYAQLPSPKWDLVWLELSLCMLSKALSSYVQVPCLPKAGIHSWYTFFHKLWFAHPFCTFFLTTVPWKKGMWYKLHLQLSIVVSCSLYLDQLGVSVFN